MTLNLLTQTPEGLVMLCDSMVSAQWRVKGQLERVNFEHARKLFHLGQNVPAAAMINGDANIGSTAIGQLLRDASRSIDSRNGQLDHDGCVSFVSDRICSVYDPFVTKLKTDAALRISSEPGALETINNARQSLKQPPFASVTSDLIAIEGIDHAGPSVETVMPPTFMVILGSYFDQMRASSMYWPGVVRHDLIDGPGAGLWWWGSGSVPLIRLINGVDIGELEAEAGKKRHHATAALRYFEKNGGKFSANIALDVMPVQQAIHFSEYLATVASGYDRFQVGPHTVGGEIDVIALIDGKLKWIHKQRLASSFEPTMTRLGQ